MASLFKPTIISYTLPNGKTRLPDGTRVNKDTPGAVRHRRKAKKWYGKYTDADGLEQRPPLSVNKTVAQQMLTALVNRTELGKVGIVDPFEQHRRRPLAEHLNDYEAALLAKGTSPKQVGQVLSRARNVVTGCKFVFMADLSASRVQAFVSGMQEDRRPVAPIDPTKEWYTKGELAAMLGMKPPAVVSLIRRHRLAAEGNGRKRRFPRVTAEELRERVTRGRGTQTRNFYLGAVKQFCNWLVEDRRMVDNPLAHLAGGNVKLDRRHDRRSLTEAELLTLLENTRTDGRTFRGMTGGDRHMVYVLACVTGLRRFELATLTPRSFDLDAEPPTVSVRAGYTKNHKTAVQPLPLDVAEVLPAYLDGRDLDAPLWPGTWHDKAAEMLQADLEAVGIPYVIDGAEGPLYADFHALRHSYVSLLDKSGATLKEAMQLARHSDPRLTMARYGRAQLHDLGSAVDRLPNLTGQTKGTANVVKATGTDGGPSVPYPAPCTGFVPKVATERLPMMPDECREGDSSATVSPDGERDLIVFEGVQEEMSEVHLAGLEPATFGSVVRYSI